ncbi:hypothetical protein [Micromonospora sp. NPDC049274]|uniref:hypothetical protein n=1 Tax=Micromonospora sp. NPDC049274 TaxID=3154829 RepID=UPI003432716A
MGLPFGDIFTGISDMGGHMLELYRIKRDGTFFDQQQFLSELRMREARDAEVISEERERRLAVSSDEDARRQREHDNQRSILQAGLEVAVHRQLRELKVEESHNPFLYGLDRVSSVVSAAIGDSRRPVLLFAPFYHDDLNGEENDQGAHSFRVAIRRSWLGKPWHDDVVPLDGLISRPLRNTDADLLVMQQALKGIPLILVYGEVQDSSRVWASVTGWNLAQSDHASRVQINLPPMSFDAHSQGSAIPRRLQFEDALGDRISLVVGAMAEWFHVANLGRQPRLHRLLLEDDGAGHRHFAAAAATAYEVAAEQNVMSKVKAMVCQAGLYAEVGLTDAAKEVSLSAYSEINKNAERSSSLDRADLRTLATTLASVGELDAARRLEDAIEEAAKKELLDFFGLDT